ncbi:MAG: peptide chain release factor N(5)-glutamine methyltransferase [Anaerovoracaceae bacterium]
MTSLRDTLAAGRKKLEESSKEDADIDAKRLLAFVTGLDETKLFLNYRDTLSDDVIEKYEALIEKRAQGVPLQHLTGTQNFMGFDFRVNDSVLIPRRDTEIVVEEALKRLDQIRAGKPGKLKLLDLCCGSGAIGIAAALLFPGELDVTMSDVSREAVETAAGNAEMNGVSDSVRVVESDLFSGISEDGFDMIISNPPYIKTGDIAGLDTEVKDHEPELALDGGEDGLDFYRRIIPEAHERLMQGGWLVFEIGYDEGADVQALMRDAGFAGVAAGQDLAGLDRFAEGRK